MKRIYYLQRIILSVLLLLPLSGCFDSDINRKMYEADDDEMQRENHIVGATLRVCLLYTSNALACYHRSVSY